jgi:hypothetical protein
MRSRDGSARTPPGHRQQGRVCDTRRRERSQLVGRGAGIGRLNREIFDRAVEIGDDISAREWAMFMILVTRAVGIAEQVVFVVTGLFREFADASQPE